VTDFGAPQADRRARVEAENWAGEIEGIEMTPTFLRIKHDDPSVCCVGQLSTSVCHWPDLRHRQRRCSREAGPGRLGILVRRSPSFGAAVSPLVQSLTPPRSRMPGADRTRRRIGQGPSTELVIESSNDSTQFSTGTTRQRAQGGFQLVAGIDRITPRTVGPRTYNQRPGRRRKRLYR